jgi:hypothetical protein
LRSYKLGTGLAGARVQAELRSATVYAIEGQRMKIIKTLFWVGAAATAVPLVRKLLAGAGAPSTEGAVPYLPVVEKTLEEHAGEETQIVRAFADALADARPAPT